MSDPEKNDPTMSEPQGGEAVPERGPSAAQNEPSAADKKREKAVRAICAVLFALIFTFVGIIAGWFIGASSVDERARNLAWLVERVEDNYYKEIDDEELYDRLYSALELDKFCTYYNEDEYDRLVSESKGNNEGYGISLVYEGDAVRVYNTVYNSPAERAGLAAGMYIYQYGETESDLSAATRENFYSFLTAHSSVTLKAGHSEESAALISMTRAKYLAAYCEYSDSEKSFRFRGDDKLTLTEAGAGMSVLDGDTAYIRLKEFDGKAAKEFETCLKTMKERGRTNLILDLRSNGGGYLTTLCDIAAHLLKGAEGRSPLVASSRYRSGKTGRYTASGNDFYDYFSADSRIRVLADENTASASEALMGAMICYGTISADDIFIRVNDTDGLARTYGKGVMQSTYTAPNGRALRLTVAEIFWPDGTTCIHDVGIRAEGDHAVIADRFASAEEFIGKSN